MSYVTNLILATPIYFDEEKERITKEINAFFEDSRGVVNCDDESLPNGWYGGTKYLEAELFIGAFNYLQLDEFIEHLKTKVNWDVDYEDYVQVIVKEQEDDKFRIIEFKVETTRKD